MDVNVSRRVLTISHCTDTGCTQSTDRTIKNAQQPGPAKKTEEEPCSRVRKAVDFSCRTLVV